jgi:pimeloyl-ACP methyl ester carboxylesterase
LAAKAGRVSWLLLRGLTREARHWGTLPQRIERLLIETPGLEAAQAQVWALDLPGNGALCGQASPRSVHAMVDLARQQLRERCVAPPYSLLAMSLGGMVATDWAQRFPQEIARLVLVNTSLRAFSSAGERLRPQNWLGLARLAVRWGSSDHIKQADAIERAIHSLTCRRLNTREQDIAAWAAIRRDAPVSAANAARQLWAAATFKGAAVPRCAVLVLSSLGDQLVHPRCSAQVARAWQAPHDEHPWAGHDLPHDDPEWLCQRLGLWLSAH